MIFGDYPCCEHPLDLPLAEGQTLPCFERHICPGCGSTVWTKHSRVSPETFTEEQFNERFVVDGASIRSRAPEEVSE